MCTNVAIERGPHIVLDRNQQVHNWNMPGSGTRRRQGTKWTETSPEARLPDREAGQLAKDGVS